MSCERAKKAEYEVTMLEAALEVLGKKLKDAETLVNSYQYQLKSIPGDVGAVEGCLGCMDGESGHTYCITHPDRITQLAESLKAAEKALADERAFLKRYREGAKDVDGRLVERIASLEAQLAAANKAQP